MSNSAMSSVDSTTLPHCSPFNDYHFSSFVSMEASISIVPRFTMDSVRCITGTYGPFTANFPIQVPLWLALHFRSTNTCTINAPAFLKLDYLRDVLERESISEGSFEPLPYYFFEMAKMLTEHCTHDVPHVAEVTRLTSSISALRKRKLQRSMAVFESDEAPMFIPGIKLSNLVSHELHFLRHSFAVVLRQAYYMDRRRRGTEVLHRIGSGGAMRQAHGAAVAPVVMMPHPEQSQSQQQQSQQRMSTSSLYSSRPSLNATGSEMRSSWTAATTRMTATNASSSSSSLSSAAMLHGQYVNTARLRRAQDAVGGESGRVTGAGTMDTDDMTSITASSVRETDGSFSQTTTAMAGPVTAYDAPSMSACGVSLDTSNSQQQRHVSLSQMSGTTTMTEMTWGGAGGAQGSQQDPFAHGLTSLQPPVKKRRTLRQT